MMKTLFVLTLLTACLASAFAQDTTALQVAPSDTVKYPDASEILNKTGPRPPTAPAAAVPVTQPLGLPTAKPLVTSVPVPAKAAAAAPAPGAAPKDTEHGWFLKWTLTGSEEGVGGWTKALGLPTSVRPLSPGLWEVWAGPLEASALKDAVSGQGGIATLVKK